MPFEQAWANTVTRHLSLGLMQLGNVLTNLPLATAVTTSLFGTAKVEKLLSGNMIGQSPSTTDHYNSTTVFVNVIRFTSLIFFWIFVFEILGFYSGVDINSLGSQMSGHENGEDSAQLNRQLFGQLAMANASMDSLDGQKKCDDDNHSEGGQEESAQTEDQQTGKVTKMVANAVEKTKEFSAIMIFQRKLDFCSKIFAIALWWACLVKMFGIGAEYAVKGI